MNLKYWICPNCDYKNIDDSSLTKFKCAKCNHQYLYNQINFFDDEDDTNDDMSDWWPNPKKQTP